MDILRELGLSEEEADAFNAISKAMALLRRAADRNLAELSDVSRTQFQILSHLAMNPPGMRMYELADLLTLSRSTLTYHITELEKRGLVTKEGGTPKRRGVSASITPAGREVLLKIRQGYIDLMKNHFIDAFAPEDLPIITSGFNRICASFGPESTDETS